MHEFQTRITVIRGYVQLIQRTARRDGNGPRLDGYLDTLLREIDRLNERMLLMADAPHADGVRPDTRVDLGQDATGPA